MVLPRDCKMVRDEKTVIHILAISGSLRNLSSNTSLLRAAALLAPEGVAVALYKGLGGLPHFSPDLEGMETQAVVDFRQQLKDGDGVWVSAPEYA
jgi:chromate reductase, NAD(P)H dehydrogenase (quinone)